MARGTKAVFARWAVMNQPVQNTAFGVEFRGDFVEIPGVAIFVPAPYGPGRQVCDLHNAGSPRIDEQRNLRQVAEIAPSCPVQTKSPGKALKRGLVILRFVHDNESALRAVGASSPAVIFPPQQMIEAVADFLERVFDRIVGRALPLVNGNRKQFAAPVACAQNIQGALNDRQAILARDTLPRMLSSFGYNAGVKFDFLLGDAQIQRLDELVESSDQMIYLALEYRHAAQNEIILGRVLDAAGSVDIEEVHTPFPGFWAPPARRR